MVYLDSVFENEGLIGGSDCYVEIDESKIGKRKYNRGRMVDGTWKIGMIERRNDGELGRFRIEICPNNERNEENLVELIRKLVVVGSNIETDGWASYQNLDLHGYHHRTVIHDRQFVDPDKGCHIQTVESHWRSVKRRLTRGG
jgi:hypothetical protein